GVGGGGRVPETAVSSLVVKLSFTATGRLFAMITSVGSVFVLLAVFGSDVMDEMVTVLFRSAVPPVGAPALTWAWKVMVTSSPGRRYPKLPVNFRVAES